MPSSASIGFDGRDLLVKPPTYPSTEVKEILGGRWDKEQKAWVVAATSLNLLQLREWYGDPFLDTAPDFIQDLAKEDWGFERWDDAERAEAEAHPAWETLYPYQRDAVEYLIANPHGASLLGLSPGLGKTPVSVVAANLLEAEKILVLSPVSLARNWEREWNTWSATDDVVKVATAEDKTPGPRITITNHETLREVVLQTENGSLLWPDQVGNQSKIKRWIENGPQIINDKGDPEPARKRIVRVRRDYLEINWDLVIIDESLLVKNRKAQRSQIVKTLTKEVENIFLLSGSPTSKYNDDLYQQMQILFPRGFKSYWRFAETFCVVDRGQWGWSIEGDKPTVSPKHLLRDFMFIRTQEEVLPEIPDYIPKPLPLEFRPAQKRAYETMLDEWIVELENMSPTEHVETPGGEDVLLADEIGLETTSRLGQLVRMQQITSNMATLPKYDNKTGDKTGGFYAPASAKEDALVQLIKDSEIEFPLLVWAWWVPTAHSIKRRLEKEFKDFKVAVVTGKDTGDEKDRRIQAYKNGEYDVLVLQMNVGRYGHTLTNSKTVYYHDRSWDADAWVQSLARVRRIGLEHSPVLYVPHIEGSADDLVELNLLGKIQSIARLTSKELLELLQDLKEGNNKGDGSREDLEISIDGDGEGATISYDPEKGVPSIDALTVHVAKELEKIK